MDILVRLLKESTFVTLTEFLIKGISFVIGVLIARTFGAEILGQYAYAVAFVSMFLVYSDFNLGGMIIREIAIDKTKAQLYINNSLLIKIVLSILVIFVTILAVTVINKPENVILLILLFLVYAIIKSFNDFFYAVLKGYEKIKYVLYLRLTESIITLLFFLVLLFLKQTLPVIVSGFILSSSIIFILALNLLRKKFVGISIGKNIKAVRYLARRSFYFGITLIFVTMYFSVDTLMISFLKGDVATGLYAVAFTFFMVAASLIQPLASILYPTLSRKMFESNSCIRKQIKILKRVIYYSNIIILLSVVIVIVYFLFADNIIRLLYGENFIRAAKPFKVLALIIPFWYMRMIVEIIFSSLGKEHIITISMFFGIIINVSLNWFLIPIYAETGAAIASLITMFILSITIYIKLIIFYKSLQSVKC